MLEKRYLLFQTMGLWELLTLSGFMHNLIIFPVKLFFYPNMIRRISDSCLILYPFHCLSWIKMQEVAAVLLTCSLHAFLCSLLNMNWHVLDYVSICSLGLQWFLNSALLSRFPACLNQLRLLFLATKGNWNSNFFSCNRSPGGILMQALCHFLFSPSPRSTQRKGSCHGLRQY